MNKNIFWCRSTIARGQREIQNGHKSFILWFTGLSGSGKSTLAHYVENILFERGYRTYVIDGDNIRHGLCSDLGFSEKDRRENIRRVGDMSRHFLEAGVITLAALISPFLRDRQLLRSSVAEGDFIEIYCNAPLTVCECRDPKGLYHKARAGEIAEFTGISSPYETPDNPEITVMTGEETIQTCSQAVIEYLERKGKLQPLRMNESTCDATIFYEGSRSLI